MIKILRLKTGEDIISFIEKSNRTITLHHPICIYIKFNTIKSTQELIMSYWLPNSLLKTQTATIPCSEVLAEMEPKESFKQYYLKFLNEPEDDLSSESINVEEETTKNTKTIH